jgi:hypothetical protein
MKLTSRLILLASALAFACTFTTPVVRAAAEKTPEQKAAAKAKKDADNLKKYDENKNGKLDPNELAKLKADEEKAKEAKKKKN